ncbi:MAG: hypothetical protein JSR85_09010 [Proteobacteria bacterium]|nr:hypothetical protein [Pseudomonadota bacterium]
MKISKEDVEEKINTLKQSKQEKDRAKQRLDLDIKQLNDQIETLKESIPLLFSAEKSKEMGSSKQPGPQVKNDRIDLVVDFMRLRGGKDIHAKEVAEYLNLHRITTRNWMIRVARKPNSPWIFTKDQSTYSLNL